MNKQALEENRKALVDSIIVEIEKGVLPWESGLLIACNAVTLKNYKGNNLIALLLKAQSKGYQDPRWMTFNQAKSKGWSIKSGEKSVSLEKYLMWDTKTKKEFDKKSVENLTATEREAYLRDNVRFHINSFNVFNAEQVIGIPALSSTKTGDWNPNLENIIMNSPCPIIKGGYDAYYSPLKDEIHVPDSKDFVSIGQYYATVLHEMAHSTGHASRLNRDMDGIFGSEKYAREEIRAELASLFTQAEAGGRTISKKIQSNSAAYLESWVNALKEDYTEFYRSTSDAGKIATYLSSLGKGKVRTVIDKKDNECEMD